MTQIATVIGCSRPTVWYANCIRKQFEVVYAEKDDIQVASSPIETLWILACDCKITNKDEQVSCPNDPLIPE